MQFAGQRVDLDLNIIGDPHNIVIELTDDVLPDPDAIMVTGITPQFTKSEGTTEAEFLKTFHKEIALPGTIFVGYNTVRFDDEFMRCMLYRNFYDPYQWQWMDNRSKWDLLDVVRLTRALRPDGIQWPVDEKGNPTNRLELLTSLNGLSHTQAHDALNDVMATISLAQLIRDKQPKLFDYLLSMRDKKPVRALVETGAPFVYASGRYPYEFQKTTIAVKIAEHPNSGGALVYDLRHDPELFANMSVSQLVESWRWIKKEDRTENSPRLPVKALQYNRCPAIAPLAVIKNDTESQNRLQLDMNKINVHYKKLTEIAHWPDRILKALQIIDGEQKKRFEGANSHVDSQLYNGFIQEADQKIMQQIRRAKPEQLGSFIDACNDPRLKKLLPLYKARNFPRKLSAEERIEWEKYRTAQLFKGGASSRLAKYFARLDELVKNPNLSSRQKSILEDLALYGQSLMPSDFE